MITQVRWTSSKYILEFEFDTLDAVTHVEIAAQSIKDHTRSIICTENNMMMSVADVPTIRINAIDNLWELQTIFLKRFMIWIATLQEKEVDKWMDEDRLQGEWQ